MNSGFTKTTLITSCILAALSTTAHAEESAANHSNTQPPKTETETLFNFYGELGLGGHVALEGDDKGHLRPRGIIAAEYQPCTPTMLHLQHSIKFPQCTDS